MADESGIDPTAPLLLDTGAFVAIIDRSEARHSECVAGLEQWQGPLLTTEAVLTETLYLVGPTWRAQRLCFEILRRGAVTLVPSSLASLLRVSELMNKYQDLPMDFADGTLVALGEEVNTQQVFTLDRKGFAVYRLHGRKSFHILP